MPRLSTYHASFAAAACSSAPSAGACSSAAAATAAYCRAVTPPPLRTITRQYNATDPTCSLRFQSTNANRRNTTTYTETCSAHQHVPGAVWRLPSLKDKRCHCGSIRPSAMERLTRKARPLALDKRQVPSPIRAPSIACPPVAAAINQSFHSKICCLKNRNVYTCYARQHNARQCRIVCVCGQPGLALSPYTTVYIYRARTALSYSAGKPVGSTGIVYRSPSNATTHMPFLPDLLQPLPHMSMRCGQGCGLAVATFTRPCAGRTYLVPACAQGKTDCVKRYRMQVRMLTAFHSRHRVLLLPWPAGSEARPAQPQHRYSLGISTTFHCK